MTVLFFLHGLGQTPQAWQDQVTALPAGIRAHAPWLHGLRPDQPAPFDVGAAADDVLSLIPQFTAGPVALCGLSLGAMVALEAALRAPDAVSHLVLIAGQVNPPRAVMAAQRMTIRLLPARKLAAAGLNKKALLQVMDAVAKFDVRSRLMEVRAKTLVIVGEQDAANRPAAEALARGIPSADLLVIPGAGHELNVQAPKALNDALYGFIS